MSSAPNFFSFFVDKLGELAVGHCFRDGYIIVEVLWQEVERGVHLDAGTDVLTRFIERVDVVVVKMPQFRAVVVLYLIRTDFGLYLVLVVIHHLNGKTFSFKSLLSPTFGIDVGVLRTFEMDIRVGDDAFFV